MNEYNNLITSPDDSSMQREERGGGRRKKRGEVERGRREGQEAFKNRLKAKKSGEAEVCKERGGGGRRRKFKRTREEEGKNESEMRYCSGTSRRASSKTS